MKNTAFSEGISYKLFRLVFLTSILLLFIIQAIDYLNFGVDDVFISMRVAENAAKGNGVVYNVGENVEGYSNPLWVAMLAFGAFLGLGISHSALDLLWFAKGMSFAFGIGVLTLLFFIAKNVKCANNRVMPLKYLVLLVAVSCGPFVLWCCGGLEALATAFFLTFSILLFQKIWKKKLHEKNIPASCTISFSVVLALSALTRPEPLLHAVFAIVFTLFIFRKSLYIREVLSIILPFITIFSFFMIWRYLTYHDLLPNTFYAKTGGGFKSYILSIKYIFGGICIIGGPMILAIPFAYQSRTQPLFRYCLVLVSASFLFMLYSGGDWMAGYRFFIPIAPVFFLAVSIGISRMIRSLSNNLIVRKGRLSKFLLFILLLCFSMAFACRILIRGQIQTMETGFSSRSGHSSPWNFDVGIWIHTHSNAGVIATGEAGVIAYLNPNMRIIDLLGLNDKFIAHNIKKGVAADVSYVLDQKPDYIILPSGDAGTVILSGSQPDGSYYSALEQSERLRKEYHLEKRFISLDLFARNE